MLWELVAQPHFIHVLVKYCNKICLNVFLSIFILMDYLFHIDTISVELSIFYFKGLSVKWCISFPYESSYLSKQCGHWYKAAFHLGLLCLPKSRKNRGSYMSAHALLNLLNELGKRDKMRGLPSILSLFRNAFNKFNNTRARMLDSIYHMTNTLKSHFWRKKRYNFVIMYATLLFDIYYKKVNFLFILYFFRSYVINLLTMLQAESQ